MNNRYLVYSDESGGAGERFRALGAVAGEARPLQALEEKLRAVARACQVEDLKWSQVRTRPNKLRACGEFLDLAVQALASRQAVLAVVLWEIPEEVHRVKPREDLRVLSAMYARLLRLAAGFYPEGPWLFRPDLRTGMDWKIILKEVNRKGGFRFTSCRPQSSRESVLVQLADLVAGMTRLTREKSLAWRTWLKGRGLSGPAGRPGQGMTALENRFAISADFVENCRRHGLASLWGPGGRGRKAVLRLWEEPRSRRF